MRSSKTFSTKPSVRRVAVALASLALLAGGAPSLWAFAPVPQGGMHQGATAIEQKLVSLDNSKYANDPRWVSFLNRYGGTWWGGINAYTGTVDHVMGSGIQVLPEVMNTLKKDDVEAAMRSFFRMNETLIGVDTRDLVTENIWLDGDDMWRGYFRQTYKGIEVRSAFAEIVIKKGRVIMFGGETFPIENFDVSSVVSQAEAMNIVAASVEQQESDVLEGPNLVIYPRIENDAVVYHLAHAITVKGSDAATVKNVTTYLDATRGDVLEQYSNVASYDGNAKIRHDFRTATVPNLVDDNCSYLNVVVGASSGCTAYPTGNYNIAGSGSATLTAALLDTATCGRVRSDNRAGADVTFSQSTTGTLNFTISSGDQASMDCFYFVPDLKELIRTWYTNANFINKNQLCNLNLSGSCNAFWNGTSINFYPLVNNCQSTGRIADVIQHEFGHGLDGNGTGGAPDGGYGEYHGDAMSMWYWDDCRLGLGFYVNLPNNGLRNLCIDRKYPSYWNGCGGEVHCQGVAMGSVSWDAWSNVKNNPSSQTSTIKRQEIFYRTVFNTQRIGGTWYANFLVYDDDDGNLGNGTPNACVVWDAFNAHGDAGVSSWGASLPATRPPCFGTHGGGGGQVGVELITGPGPNPATAGLVTEWQHDYTTKVVEFASCGTGYGCNVSAGNMDASALHEVLTAPGPSPTNGPQVRAYQAATSTAIAKVNFYAYGTLKYGANVTTGNWDGDAYAEIGTGAGPGSVFGPHVRGWNYDGSALSAMQKINFFAYATLKYGVNVGSGDLTGGNNIEIITGAGPSAAFGPQVRAFQYTGTVSALSKVNFNAYSSGFYGVRIAGSDYDADRYHEIMTGRGPNAALDSEVKGYQYDNNTISAGISQLNASGLSGGAIVAGGDIDGTAGDEFVAASGGLGTADNANVRGYKVVSGVPTSIPPQSPFVAYSGNTYGATLALGEIGNF
ncbi:MAG: hypothetical protein U0166_25725 [Acidobacteriota bacterium]